MHKARVCLCLQSKNKVFKLAWVNEDSKGVYVGTYGAHAGMHFSYHADGTSHFKGPNRRRLLKPSSQTPITSISHIQPLTVMAVPLEYEETVNRSTHIFRGDKNAVVVFIGGNQEFEASVLNLSEFIIHRSAEASFAEKMYLGYAKLPNTRLVGFVTVPLTYFPDHKVCLVISAISQVRTPSAARSKTS